MENPDKDIVWFSGDIKTPPFSTEARLEAGFLLRRLQQGKRLSMPDSRPMPSIGKRCHELRIKDENEVFRIVYRIDPDAIVILEVFKKKSRQTPQYVIDNCKSRIRVYDQIG
ncbi:type II toxin-antitoxin system RelE/ParE family toxin [Gemmatimonadota bacterium]